MSKIAICQGENILRVIDSTSTINLPDGSTILGLPSTLPYVSGDYVIRKVDIEGPVPGPNEVGSTNPPVLDGDRVLILRTVSALPADMIAARMNAIRAAKIQAIDEHCHMLRSQGALYNGKRYQVREGSYAEDKIPDHVNIALAAGEVLACLTPDPDNPGQMLNTWDSTYTWRAVDNTETVFATAKQANEFLSTLRYAHNAWVRACIVKRAEVEALPDDEAIIQAYDVTANWPAI